MGPPRCSAFVIGAVISLGALLARGPVDLAVEVSDQRDEAVQSPARRVARWRGSSRRSRSSRART
jgi:hypothetical protein